MMERYKNYSNKIKSKRREKDIFNGKGEIKQE
jgi:hypothetical protein